MWRDPTSQQAKPRETRQADNLRRAHAIGCFWNGLVKKNVLINGVSAFHHEMQPKQKPPSHAPHAARVAPLQLFNYCFPAPSREPSAETSRCVPSLRPASLVFCPLAILAFFLPNIEVRSSPPRSVSLPVSRRQRFDVP